MSSATTTRRKEYEVTVSVTTKTEVSQTEEVTVLDQSAEALIVKFNSDKAAIKALETSKATTEAALRGMLGTTKVGTINGVERVRIHDKATTWVDRDVLKTAFPEAFEATIRKTPYTVLLGK